MKSPIILYAPFEFQNSYLGLKIHNDDEDGIISSSFSLDECEMLKDQTFYSEYRGLLETLRRHNNIVYTFRRKP